jgi:hypothetical protein
VLAVATAALAPLVPAAFTHDAAIAHEATTALLVSALTQPLAASCVRPVAISDYRAMRRAMIRAALLARRWARAAP